MKQKEKDDRNLNRALLIMTVLFVVFTAAVLLVYHDTGSEPTELVRWWGLSVLAEIMACVRIKIGKKRDKYHEKYEESKDGKQADSGSGYQV